MEVVQTALIIACQVPLSLKEMRRLKDLKPKRFQEGYTGKNLRPVDGTCRGNHTNSVPFLETGGSDSHRFLSKMIMRPSRVKNASTWSMLSHSSLIRGASPPVATTFKSQPASFLILFTIPSTNPAYP